jgi:polyisoprenoid-binding protein YceI
MLRPEVLDAARYPEIVVRSASIEGSFEQPRVRSAITIRGVTRTWETPVQMQRTGSRIAVSGSFRLRQSDFDIAPFSVAGGAVQVADEIDVRFRLVAARRAD